MSIYLLLTVSRAVRESAYADSRHEEGSVAEEATHKANLLKTTARIMFTVNTLEYPKGRRIGR